MPNLIHSLHLHPALVHFPIALFIAALGFEIGAYLFHKDSFHQTSRYLYILGALLSPIAVLTGLLEQDYLNLNHPILETHKQWGFGTMGLSLGSLPVLWFIQKSRPALFRAAFLVCLIALTVTVCAGSYYGGTMVYEYGVGIDG